MSDIAKPSSDEVLAAVRERWKNAANAPEGTVTVNLEKLLMVNEIPRLCDALEAEIEARHGFARAVDHEMGRVIEREKEISRLHEKFGVEPEIWTSILNCVRKVSDGEEGDDVHPLARVYVFGARHMAEELRDG